MNNTLIFKTKSDYISKSNISLPVGFKIIVWKPSLLNFIPPWQGKKYIIYWLFHFLHIFRNKEYSAILIYHDSVLAASLLIVPSHFKWPFMKKDDVQFTFVMTSPSYRGRGIGEQMLRFAIKSFEKTGRVFLVCNQY
jgi:ribosomal protein S18 acetylase RimI-like enzyme